MVVLANFFFTPFLICIFLFDNLQIFSVLQEAFRFVTAKAAGMAPSRPPHRRSAFWQKMTAAVWESPHRRGYIGRRKKKKSIGSGQLPLPEEPLLPKK